MTKVYKQTIKVIFSLILLIMVFIGFMFANHSLAWFARNENVGANGLSASVKVSPNLIIAKDPDTIRRGDLIFDVNFHGTARENMIAVTHDDNVSSTFLKYVTNHYAVDTHTGNVKDGATLEFANVPTENNEAYFIDYTVYIASAFEALDITALNATLIIPESVDVDHPYFYAASIDFYVEEVTKDNYRGTTSVAEALNTKQYKGVNLFPDGHTVPLNTEGYITVIMRCYFDGALQDEHGNAYINSYTVKSDGVVIGVAFTAEEAQSED